MNIAKKVKCVHCNSQVEDNGACTCGKVKLTNGTITEGKLGSDYIDVSQVLLNETA